MVAASAARRETLRARATKVAASSDDHAVQDKPKVKPPAKAASTKAAPSGRLAKAAIAKRAPLNALGGRLDGEESPSAEQKLSLGAIKKAKPNALVQRVYNTIDGELTKLEKQKGLTSQDRERASRALSQMVNALEKAVEMQRDMTKRKPTGGDAKSKEALAHAEDLRREIAERLERLNRKRAPGRRSE
jgi:hypothetical protein